ncbi:hypothetical protein Q5424_02595 [Conexibacter sp. JD483]|uniref:hypothetical protein n=1 Tax=unclassified Conexibacter TaxID=2627773 RepID=UPI00271ECAD0|nr:MULTISPECIES: hypothetical protein [unclassified Conexibacter]MDO8184043.1 hypothetical protein [Conexibacter sp. CPCC 205706]MDO8197035.1 hypothetical protein [Conexibacter sp. CPCC 205762]MDR9367951.1 hypothetical protein [Conexibacter sp. JD483]
MRFSPLPLILAVLALGVTAAPAAASTADAIIKDCSTSPTGLLTGSYAKSDLRDARKLVRGDIAEYTGCMDAINAALNARAPDNGNNNSNGGNGGNGGNGSNGSNGSNGGNTSPGTSSPGSTPGSSSGSDGSFGSTAGSTSNAPGNGSGDGGASSGTTPAPAPAPTPAPTQQAGSGAPVRVGGTTVTPGIPASFSDDRRALPTPLIAFLVLLAAGAIGFGAPTIGRRVLARRRA